MAKWRWVILFIVAEILVGSGGVWLGKQTFSPKTAPTPIVQIPTPTNVPSIWKTYTDSVNGFSYKYPPYWVTPWASCNIPTPVPGELGHGRSVETNCLETIIFAGKDVNQISGEPVLTPYLVSDINTTVNGFPAERKLYTLNKDQPPTYYEMRVFQNSKPILVWSTTIGPNTNKANSSRLIAALDWVLSTFRFLSASSSPPCKPRPKCLDSNPRCMLPETPNMCPRSN